MGGALPPLRDAHHSLLLTALIAGVGRHAWFKDFMEFTELQLSISGRNGWISQEPSLHPVTIGIRLIMIDVNMKQTHKYRFF